jgi:hypothetical protein
MFFSMLFFCEHSLFAPRSNLQIFRITCFYFEILFFFSCGFIVILSKPHDVETFCICYQWGIIVVWSYSCFSKGLQARFEVLSILFLEFEIVIALLRGSYYKHYPHWLTSLQHPFCLLSITWVDSRCDNQMFLNAENYFCVWHNYISCGHARSYKNGVGWWLHCMFRLLNAQTSNSKRQMWKWEIFERLRSPMIQSLQNI